MNKPLHTRRLRASRGAAMVEMAIMLPLLVVLILWANYFWEVSLVRIKAAEVSRFIAFERTVRKDTAGILSEAKDRYRDLDGSNKGVASPVNLQNTVTLTVSMRDMPAPISGKLSDANNESGGKAGGFMGQIASMVGDSVETIIGFLGFDTSKGAVQADVTFQVKNKIIPGRIASYVSGPSGNALDLKFTDSFFVYHDTWRAWDNGHSPKNTYPDVQRLTQDRVMKIAYLGLVDKAPVLSQVGNFLSILGLEWPLGEDYIRDSVLMRRPQKENSGINPRDPNGYYRTMGNRENRTVPGDILQAGYWKNDDKMCFNGCEPKAIKDKRGWNSSQGDAANWPYRAYNCRGDFFQGATKSDEPELTYSRSYGAGKKYFNYNNKTACIEQ